MVRSKSPKNVATLSALTTCKLMAELLPQPEPEQNPSHPISSHCSQRVPGQAADYSPTPLKSTLIIRRAKMSEAIRNSQTHNISPSPRFPLALCNNRQQACKLLSCNCSKSNNYNLSERINFPISHKDV